MWKPIEDTCNVCGVRIGASRLKVYGPNRDDTYHEDGSLQYIRGSSIEDDDGNYLTVCEDCLRAIVGQRWDELMELDEGM